MTERLHFHFSLSHIGEGNGNPLQCSCLDPRDGGAWWAAVHGVNWSNLAAAATFPGSSVVKNPPANAEDAGSIPGSGRSPGKGNSNPLQCSCLGNPMDRGAWQAPVRGVARVWHNLAIKTTTILCACVLSHLCCIQLCATPWIVARQAPLSMEFSRQEYWSGLSFPFPEHSIYCPFSHSLYFTYVFPKQTLFEQRFLSSKGG